MNVKPAGYCFGIPVPYTSAPGLGKWDRIMTYGQKVQFDTQGNGTLFDFNTESFCQIVDNFSRVFQARRLGLDYKHVAANPEIEPGPEQNLAYYSGLCVIEQGKVIKIWDHSPDRAPPDPQVLLQEMQSKFPRLTELENADGLWGYKCEITPLGIEKLPNCEQLSPYFSKNDFDEFGNQIGYNLLNVSAVGVAFQDGTTLNLGKFPPTSVTPFSKKELPGIFPLSKTTPSHRNQTMNDMLSPEMMGKLMKHGLMAETDKDQMRAAYEKYMSETEDGPTDRKMMAEMYAKCMSKMNMDEPKEKDMPDSMGHEEPDGDEQKMSKQIQSSQEKAVVALSKQLQEMKTHFEEQEKKKAQAEERAKAVAFAKQAVSDGRYPAEDEAELVNFALAGYGERAIKPFPKGTFTVMKKWTQAGSPSGANQANQSGISEKYSYLGTGGTLKVLARGKDLSTMAKQLSKEKGIPLGEAQREILKQNPDLY